VLICFEAIFPAAARGLAAAGADVFINLTNDVLLGAGAEQMAAMSVFRSVENRVPLVRVANMGPSLLVDSYGRIVARERGFSAANWRVELSSGEAPPYRAIGDYFGSFFAVVAVLAIGLGARSGVPGVAYPGANERSQ
jgi:apolipoprotein N-acyltransferase